MEQKYLRAAERTFTDMKFLHGMTVQAQAEDISTALNLRTGQDDIKFDGVHIDTGKKRYI